MLVSQDYMRAYARGFFDGQLGRYRHGYTQDTMQRVLPGCTFVRLEQAAYRDGWIEGQACRVHAGI